MRLKTRIEILERKFSDDQVTLWMADGSLRLVRAKRLHQMIPEIMSGGSIASDTRAVIDSVRDNCRELGQGCLPELLKVMCAPVGGF